MPQSVHTPVIRPLVSRREDRWQLLAAVLGLLFGHLCLRWSPLLAFVGAAGLGLAIVCVARPFTGLLLILGVSLSVEQFPIMTNSRWVSLEPFTVPLGDYFFTNLSLFTKFSFLYVNFMEVLLLLVGMSWLVRTVRAGRLRWHGGPMWPPLVALVGVLAFGVVWGVARGGDLRIALWETRGLFHLVATFFLAAQLVETRSQVRTLVWTIIAAVTLRVGIAWWGAGMLRFDLSGVDTVTTHEDALFFGSLLVLWLSLRLIGGDRRQRITLGSLALFVLAAIVFSKRRAGMAALVLMVPYFLAVLDWRRMRRMLLACGAASLLLLPYVAVFWNSRSTVALPIRMLRSITEDDATDRDGSSNRFRHLENRLLLGHIQRDPIMGIGFGKPYRFADSGRRYGVRSYDVESGEADGEEEEELPDLRYELSLYVPHNQILWIWAKSGLVGFLAFWVFVIVALAQGTHLALHLKTPYLRAVAASTVLLVCMMVIAAFVDVHLTIYRNLVYMGVMLGAMSRFRAIERGDVEGVAPDAATAQTTLVA